MPNHVFTQQRGFAIRIFALMVTVAFMHHVLGCTFARAQFRGGRFHPQAILRSLGREP